MIKLELIQSTLQTSIQTVAQNRAYLIGTSVLGLYLATKAVKWILPKKKLQGEIALITGGAGSLGKLLAKNLASKGVTVVIWDINDQGVEGTVNEVKAEGGKAFGYKCNLCDKNDIYAVARKTTEEVGQITILINNAGVVSGDLLLNTPDHLIQRTFDVNILAHFWTTKAFLPKMIENNHGHIVTVASLAGYFGQTKLIDYCSSKHAAVGFDESLRMELQREGINGVKTTSICPFFIRDTGLFIGVKTIYPRPLKPKDVSDRIVKAIQNEELQVIIGLPMLFLHTKHLLPWSLGFRVYRMLVPNPIPPHLRSKANYKDIKSMQIERVIA